MKKIIIPLFKRALTVVGALTSAHILHQWQMVLNYLKLGNWMKLNNFKINQRFIERPDVFDIVAEKVNSKQVLYLEFGVWKGTCMRYWSNALKHPGSILHGFDSFEGLPEDFDINGRYSKGHFDVGGQIPQINDSRIQFFKGWFDVVLPTYKPPEHEVLIIVIDSDLYSSAVCVLKHLRQYIKPGTFLYFDDMSRPDQEPRAFIEFIKETGLRFRLVSADYSLNNAFFECMD